MAIAPLAPVVEREHCVDYARASALEWLETNGLGSFAMGTVSGASTRRYHGLFVAALRPPVERVLLLAKLEETLWIDGASTALSTNQYPGVVHPRGFQHLVDFRVDPFPTWTFEVGPLRLEKQLLMPRGEQAAVVRYRSTRPCRLEVQPLVACRDYHALRAARDGFGESIITDARRVRIAPEVGMPPLWLHHDGSMQLDGGWNRQVEYLRELDRGFPFREDLYRVGTITLELEGDRSGRFVVASLDDSAWDATRTATAEWDERKRRRVEGLAAPRGEMQQLVARLLDAADTFLVRRRNGTPSVIAGYPWFTDWGRDTMISLPGLLIARGRLDEARDVLDGFLDHLRHGLIPNRFPDVVPGTQLGTPDGTVVTPEAPEYNTVDATLWWFQAVDAYLERGGDVSWVRRRAWPAALEIIDSHRRGTLHGIGVDPDDGLLRAGDANSNLTWMDARCDGRAITPRHGKAVEINALWYGALRATERWGDRFGEVRVARENARQADVVARSFAAAFWNPARECLYDVITDGVPDARLRPNQLLAVSLPSPLLSPAQRRKVVAAVEAALLTPFGLRTLAADDEGYVGRYRGDAAARDSAYHQGTVWPWLLGPFVRAYLAANGRTPATVERGRALLRPFLEHLESGCLGSVSEVFDGDAPHEPGGCPAQAWSVAELLQLALVDLA